MPFLLFFQGLFAPARAESSLIRLFDYPGPPFYESREFTQLDRFNRYVSCWSRNNTSKHIFIDFFAIGHRLTNAEFDI